MRSPSAVMIWARYLRYLFWEFRWPLIVFWGLVFGGGWVLWRYYQDAPLGYVQACYAVFLLIFLESYLDFPDEWFLQPLFFLLPLIGLGAVADSLVRLAYLFFSRKNRLPEWQRMVASLYSGHTILVGPGKVGFRIIQGLLAMGEPVVAIQKAEAPITLVDEALDDLNVPIIRGDGRLAGTLEEANIRQAKAVILATSDDLTNLDAGLTATDLNPHVRVVLRLFDESLATKVRGAFALPAISTSQVAAPAFIAAATGRRIYQEFELGGQHLFLIDLTIAPEGRLVGKAIGAVQVECHVNIVMSNAAGAVNVNPEHDLVLRAGDEVLVIAPLEHLRLLERLNQARSRN